MAALSHRWWAPRAWIGGRWRDRVLLGAGADGCWAEVVPDVAAPEGVETLPGPVLPGLVDAHSHAFQRAFVGLAERRDAAHDDFWSWRDRMYGVALRITPEQLRAIASHLYLELLAGGYTQVCEFHYLQHDHDGSRYADPAAMAHALAGAAAEAGIGLTLLPVLYERAGFTAPELRPDQRRFATSVADVLALQRTARGPLVNAGVAVHSLRAARPETILALAEGSSGPLHIHVAEQTAEVDDCVAATGCRPIEWLTRHAPLDSRWQLVHATHTVPAEIDAIAACGAGVVLCPGTEGNLGDGLTDLPGWIAAGVPLAVGSDSQVTRAWPEELRWLEYGQRLGLRRRNVSAAPGVPRLRALRAGACSPVRAPTCSCSTRATPRCAACRPITCSTASSSPRRRLAQAARRRHRVALRRRDAGAVGARRCADASFYIMRNQAISLVMLSIAVAACDQRAAFERLIPKDDAAFAIETFDHIRRQEFEAVEARLEKAAATAESRRQLQQVAAVFGTEPPEEVRVIGAFTNTVNGAITYVNLTLEYRFARRWLVAAMALHRSGNARTIDTLRVQPTVDGQENLNRFRLSGKGLTHYAVLAWAILAPLFIIGTLVLLWRTSVPRHKWLWGIFVALGVGQVTLNWTTGETSIQLLHLALFGGGFLKPGPYAPVFLTAAVPVGAILFLWRRRRWPDALA